MTVLNQGNWSKLFKEFDCFTFEQACDLIQQLPYKRISDATDFSLVLKEGKGTCSSKHGILSSLAVEMKLENVHLYVGIFLMSKETHPILTSFFEDKPYNQLPEAHVYFKINGERVDFTGRIGAMERIAPKIVREQRIEPHQVHDWKVKTHQHYLRSWLERNPSIDKSFDEVWKEREECIAIFSGT